MNIGKGLKGAAQKSQFAQGNEPPVQQQSPPGLESEMHPRPVYDQLPTADGGYQPYRPAGKLIGKKAIITGGDSGIGRAVAVLYAMEGADVAIGYLPVEQTDAEETQRLVQSHGRKCLLIPGDLTQKEECRRLVDQAIAELGGVNILVNNCAYQMEVDTIEELSEDQWDHTFKVNIYSYFYMAKYVMPHLKFGDSIINTSSINHYKGKPNLLDYTSTKGAIIAFTRALSNQVISKGIRVNAVCPGPVWTPLVVATMTKEDLDSFASTPMGRASQPSEIATCYVFFASADGASLAGQTLHPNGGTVTGS